MHIIIIIIIIIFFFSLHVSCGMRSRKGPPFFRDELMKMDVSRWSKNWRRGSRGHSVCCVCLWAQKIALPRFRDFQLTAIWTHICQLVDILVLQRKDAFAQTSTTCPFPADSKCDTPAVLTLFVSLSS